MQSLERELESSRVLWGEPVTEAEIDRASASLGKDFPNAYREFLARFGGAVVGGFPIFGLRPVEAMGKPWSVMEVDEQIRQTGIPELARWLVISSNHAGSPIGIRPDGSVWIWDHDFGGPSELAENFEDFVLNRLSQ